MKTKKESCTLREKKLKNGNISLYLDIYANGQRKYEFLKLYLYPGTSREEKAKNANTKRIADAIRAKYALQLMNEKAGIFSEEKGDLLLVDYIERYTKVGKKNTRQNYCSMLQIVRSYDKHKKTTLAQIDKPYILGLVAAMREGRAESSANFYYSLLRHILNNAVKDKYIKENPVRYLLKEERPKAQKSERAFLTIEELKRMEENTNGINPVVVQMFLFACYCGLRFSDIQKLKWSNIQEDNGQKRIVLKMQKTGQPIYLQLNKKAVSLLPQKHPGDPQNAPVFPNVWGPTANANVHKWAKIAGIEKHITFHTSRHTYATTLLTMGADLYTVSKLLGHTNILTTQIYADIINQKRQDAVNLLDNL